MKIDCVDGDNIRNQMKRHTTLFYRKPGNIYFEQDFVILLVVMTSRAWQSMLLNKGLILCMVNKITKYFFRMH